jgi:CubicO group peptidase (beta-lactamase class C family)
VPELRAVHGPIEQVTLRQLMSHTAGFRTRSWPYRDDSKSWQPDEPLHWSQIVAILPYAELEFAPGGGYQYSNLGYIFLGQVIERVTTDDYEVYVDKNILKPLEMYRSYFDGTPYHLLRHRARSYELFGARPARAAVFDFNSGATVANSGLNAPLGDMVKYLDFLLGDEAPARRVVYDGVLARASLEEMWRPVRASDIKGEQVGTGWFLITLGGVKLVEHEGDQNHFLSAIFISPAHRAAWVVALNTDGTPDKNGGRDPHAAIVAIDKYIAGVLLPKLR